MVGVGRLLSPTYYAKCIGAYPNRINEEKRYERLNRIPQHRHRPCCGRRRRPSRPLLMAETAVWVPYESPAHVRATASSTVDVDLMVSVDGTGFASANLQHHASCSVDPSLDRHRSDACSRHSVGGAECRECAAE